MIERRDTERSSREKREKTHRLALHKRTKKRTHETKITVDINVDGIRAFYIVSRFYGLVCVVCHVWTVDRRLVCVCGFVFYDFFCDCVDRFQTFSVCNFFFFFFG